MPADRTPPPKVSKKVLELEKLRAKARAAALDLNAIPNGRAALQDLRNLATNRNGFSSLDIAYREQFEVVLRAVLAGLRDGIF